jgi:hypothetical protein
MLAVLIVWLAAMAAIYAAMGPVEPPARPALTPILANLDPRPAPELPVPPPQPREPVPPPQPREPAPAPEPPADELQGFGPCPLDDSGQGRGLLKTLDGRYDDQGRYLVLIGYEGRLGRMTVRQALDLRSLNVSYVDIAGRLPFLREHHPERAQGPVSLARLGLHRGFTRLSLNFRDRLAPRKVDLEILCRDDVLAVRYSFDSVLAARVRPSADDPAADAQAVQPGGQGGPPSPPEPPAETRVLPGDQAGPSPGAPVPDPGDGGQGDLPPPPEPPAETRVLPGGQAGPSPGAPVLDPGDGGHGDLPPPPEPPGETRVLPGDAAPSTLPADGDASLPGPTRPDREAPPFPCRGSDGNGTVKALSGGYDQEGRYVLEVELEGRPGRHSVNDILDPADGNVTYVDFFGDYGISQASLYQGGPGPVRLVRLGRHANFMRVALNYQDGRKPKKVRTEISCQPGRLVLAYSFDQPAGPSPSSPAASQAVQASPRAAPEPPLRLPGYGPCLFAADGRGSFRDPEGAYDHNGDFLLMVPFSGTLGAAIPGHVLGREKDSVSFLDFKGRYGFPDKTLFPKGPGPIRAIRFGGHKDFVRLSLTYRDSSPVRKAEAHLACSPDGLAVRLVLEPKAPPEARPRTAARAQGEEASPAGPPNGRPEPSPGEAALPEDQPMETDQAGSDSVGPPAARPAPGPDEAMPAEARPTDGQPAADAEEASSPARPVLAPDEDPDPPATPDTQEPDRRTRADPLEKSLSPRPTESQPGPSPGGTDPDGPESIFRRPQGADENSGEKDKPGGPGDQTGPTSSNGGQAEAKIPGSREDGGRSLPGGENGTPETGRDSRADFMACPPAPKGHGAITGANVRHEGDSYELTLDLAGEIGPLSLIQPPAAGENGTHHLVFLGQYQSRVDKLVPDTGPISELWFQATDGGLTISLPNQAGQAVWISRAETSCRPGQVLISLSVETDTTAR